MVTDELGIPLHPEAYSDEFTRPPRRADLPKIRLHDSRHTTLSLMERLAYRSPPSASGQAIVTPRSR